MNWYRHDAAGWVLRLQIQPGARATRVVGPYADTLKIALQAPPVDGRANEALIHFLAERFGVPATHVTLKHGMTGRRKVVEIRGSKIAPPALLQDAA